MVVLAYAALCIRRHLHKRLITGYNLQQAYVLVRDQLLSLF